MSGRAYYNEIDPYAAAWLRNLIAAGLIAPGEVDTRSIVDVLPDDLRGFEQHHWFAGIGVWSYALRLAGWPDNRPIWTASCPCQPFSAAGKGDGFADERHLWPALFHLVEVCRPGTIVGEQVASDDGLDWLDLVHDDMEGAGYAFGAVDTGSALHGAPHIRQRLRWVADAPGGEQRWLRECGAGHGPGELQDRRHGPVGFLADASSERWDRSEFAGTAGAPAHGSSEADERRPPGFRQPQRRSTPGFMGHASDTRLPPRECGSMVGTGRREEGRAAQQSGGASGGLVLANSDGRQPRQPASTPARHGSSAVATGGRDRPGPTNGFWRDPDWLRCRDGKWRPVESGTFPLAHGATARVGRLRAYGNAVDAEASKAFIVAVQESLFLSKVVA